MQPHLPESRCHGHGLMGNDPDFSGKLTGLHWEPDRGVHGPDPSVFEPAHDFPGDIVDVVARAMEFEIGHGSCRTSDRLPIHAADNADENLGRGEDLKNPLFLGGDLCPVDANEADVIGARLETQAAEVLGSDRASSR